jgi:hypothetical protein
MVTETKLRIYNVTSKVALFNGSENWIINKRDAQKLEAAQMRFLIPLLSLEDSTAREILTFVMG